MSSMKARNSTRRRRFLWAAVDLAGGQIEGGEQRRRAVPLVVVAVAAERPPVGQPEIALRPLQRLDRRLLVDAEDDGVLGRRHIEADDVGGLGDELGIVALAPRLLAVEIDPLVAQEAPHLLLVNVAQFGGDQPARPAREPSRRRPLQHRQNAPAGLGGRISASAPDAACRPSRPGLRRHSEPARCSPCSASRRPPRRSIASSGPLPPTSTIRARTASRCVVAGDRTRASSTARSSGLSRTSTALGIIPMLNHESTSAKAGTRDALLVGAAAPAQREGRGSSRHRGADAEDQLMTP